MAEPATKTKPDEQSGEQNAIEELTKRLDALAEHNAVLEETVARLQPTESPEEIERRKKKVAEAQEIVDAIAGGRGGDMQTKITRKNAREAISTIREAELAKLARKRGLQPEERATMTAGLKEHIAALGRSAEDYFEREGVGF